MPTMAMLMSFTNLPGMQPLLGFIDGEHPCVTPAQTSL
jgi:hypothetical protein